MISRTFVLSAFLLLSSSCISGARAQSTPAPASATPTASRTQPDSLGDAARQARAEKPHSAKPAKVFTNDDVHGLKDSFSEKGRTKHAKRNTSPKPSPSR